MRPLVIGSITLLAVAGALALGVGCGSACGHSGSTLAPGTFGANHYYDAEPGEWHAQNI